MAIQLAKLAPIFILPRDCCFKLITFAQLHERAARFFAVALVFFWRVYIVDAKFKFLTVIVNFDGIAIVKIGNFGGKGG